MTLVNTPSTEDHPTLLVDADLYLYRALAASEHEDHWGDDIWTLFADHKVARDIFKRNIEGFQKRLKTDKVFMCISGADNFRKRVAPTYKGGRKKSRKPCGYPAFVQWCKDTYEHGMEDTLEADDLMGILATTPGSNTIIVSDDKDMLTIPARLYLPNRGDLIDQTVAAADHAFLTQTLTGDTTDGYSGCPKVGAVTAARILGSRPDWSLVESAFIKSGLTKDDALTQARLARILRYEDWDAKNKVVKLWGLSL